MRRQRLHLLRTSAPLAVGAAVLALWEIVVRIEGIPPYILPARC